MVAAFIYTPQYTAAVVGQVSRPLVANFATSQAGPRKHPDFRSSWASEKPGISKKRAVSKTMPTRWARAKWSKNMVINTDGLSAAACERTRGL